MGTAMTTEFWSWRQSSKKQKILTILRSIKKGGCSYNVVDNLIGIPSASKLQFGLTFSLLGLSQSQESNAICPGI